MFRVYFDGSQGAEALSLAAVIADASVWDALSEDWGAMLARQGLTHFHMKEAMRRKGEFRGWDPERHEWFIHAMVSVIKMHYHKAAGRMEIITTSVDLDAHRELSQTIPGLPPAARMCARGLFAKCVNWWSDRSDKVLPPLEAFFDRNEPFMDHVRRDWLSAEFTRQHPAWHLVRDIAPVEMRSTPGVQVADVFAWTRNRREAKSNDDFYVMSLGLMNSLGQHFAFDRAKLETYPPFELG